MMVSQWLVLAGVVTAMHVGKLPPAIPVLVDTLGLTLIQGGFLLSIIQLAGMSLGAIAGTVADRLGPRRMMLTGLVLLAAGSGLGAAAPVPSVLLWTRALEGIGFLLAVLPVPVLLRRHVTVPGELRKALGFWGAYMPIGTATALLMGPWVYATVGWRVAWLMLALGVLVCAFVVWRLVPADVAQTPGAVGVSRASQVVRDLVGGLRQTLTARGPWLVALAFLAYSGQWLAVVGFLPTLYTLAGWPVLWIGPLTALAAGANLLGNIGAGRLLARGIPPSHLLWVGYGVMAVGAFLTFSGLAHPVVQYGAVVVFSSVGGLIPGTLFVMAVQLAPNSHTVTTTVGWVQQLSSLGQFASPPFVAWMAATSGGWHWTWMFNLLCCAGGAILALLLQRLWRLRAH